MRNFAMSKVKFRIYDTFNTKWETGTKSFSNFKKFVKSYCRTLGHSLTFRTESEFGDVRQGKIIVLKCDGYGSEYQVMFSDLVTDGVVSDPIKELVRIAKLVEEKKYMADNIENEFWEYVKSK